MVANENDGEIKIVVKRPKVVSTSGPKEFVRWTPKMCQELTLLSCLGLNRKEQSEILGYEKGSIYSRLQKQQIMLRKVAELIKKEKHSAKPLKLRGLTTMLVYLVSIQDKIDFINDDCSLSKFERKVNAIKGSGQSAQEVFQPLICKFFEEKYQTNKEYAKMKYLDGFKEEELRQIGLAV